MTTDRMQWLIDAACRKADADLFFPDDEPGPARDAQVAAAKRVCAGCPVRTACLTWAIEHLTDGIAGGLDADKRRALHRAQQHSRRRGRGAA